MVFGERLEKGSPGRWTGLGACRAKGGGGAPPVLGRLRAGVINSSSESGVSSRCVLSIVYLYFVYYFWFEGCLQEVDAACEIVQNGAQAGRCSCWEEKKNRSTVVCVLVVGEPAWDEAVQRLTSKREERFSQNAFLRTLFA